MGILSVSGIGKSYPTPSEPLVVLEGFSFGLDRGESLSVMGPSGSGKSTLLAILGTLDTPSEGQLTIAGNDPFRLSEAELSSFRADHVGFVFQEHYLLPQLSAIENVRLPLLATGKPDAQSLARADKLLERVGLQDRRGHRPSELSGGERQRVAIARALVREPTLLLADEPTGNLDADSADLVAELLYELQSERDGAMILVTHSERLSETAQRHAMLNCGRLEFV